ncbi:MAG: penicillin acylase family protein [Bradymonadaceae bacterium]|nr:penicillin acylase family protein [Lujinxingiaceae bacterium]
MKSRKPLCVRLCCLSIALATSLVGCDDDPPQKNTPDLGLEDVAVDADAADSGPRLDVGDDASGPDADASADAEIAPEGLEGVELKERWELPGLEGPVHVVRTESNVPHIYATNERDLARVHGFVAARDRFFMMDLSRRLGLGKISELLGDDALGNDVEARMTGMRHVAERMLATADAETVAVMEAFAEGINAYIDHVDRALLPAPSEVDLAYRLLGFTKKTEMMHPFTSLDVTGMLTTFLYQSSFEGGDVGNAAVASRLRSLYADDAPLRSLREAGAIEDIWSAPAPLFPIASGDWGTPGGLNLLGSGVGSGGQGVARSAINQSMVDHLAESLQRQQESMRLRSQERGFGSNAWAVAGDKTTDGASLLAGDGHLPLGIPSILYQVGLDTSVFGGGDIHQLGLVIPGIPVMPLGTNGKVAWSFTQLSGDITDWYREEIRLGANGEPAESFFEGQWRPLERLEETYVIANVVALGSTGRTVTYARYKTFDGRWLSAIEGRRAAENDTPGAGEALVRMHSGFVIPADTDGDDIITAISLDYVGFDTGDMMGTLGELGRTKDVLEFRESTRGLMTSSLNFTVSDGDGNIYYSAYQAVPCRGYLPRGDSGGWAEGADPTLLLDGTRFGGFTIPMNGRRIDETPGQSDPYACVVPFEETPQRLNPASGYVLTANNDPVGVAFDNDLSSGPWYIGGPWTEGFRADTIDRELHAAIESNTADTAKMAAIQGNHDSRLGETFVPHLLEALVSARASSLIDGELTPDAQRIVDLYTTEKAAIDEIVTRLQGWRDRGYQAKSGVETFYQSVSASDREDAIATTIFNAWFGAFQSYVFNDEALDGLWPSGGSTGRIRALAQFLDGRGATNPLALASWNEATGESVFFDDLNTEVIETSAEGMLIGLTRALTFLRTEPTAPGEGGYGSESMDTWLWGLRHMVRFESLLLNYLRDQPSLANLANNFSITTKNLPLAPNLAAGDPRHGLKWFPRDGDQFNVDAANPGLSGRNFSYSSGPVMRMVIALKDGEVSGVNIIPGGQSGLANSPFFHDQARLWLGNETVPMRFHFDDVVAGARGRELYFSP